MSCRKKEQCCKNQNSQAVQDYLVCTCMGVLRSEIIQAIADGANSFQGLSDVLGVGTGCSSCVEEVMQILHKEKNKKCC